jgi:hypothetical protein
MGRSELATTFCVSSCQRLFDLLDVLNRDCLAGASGRMQKSFMMTVRCGRFLVGCLGRPGLYLLLRPKINQAPGIAKLVPSSGRYSTVPANTQ